MKTAEMAQLFTLMTLAWPNAEMLRGGIEKLEPTIRLWTQCTADVDFWTGQQAVIRLCRVCKFPPSIAELLAQAKSIEDEIAGLARDAFFTLRSATALHGSLERYYATLLPESLTRRAIDRMGGTEALVKVCRENGEVYVQWDIEAFEAACRAVIRKEPARIGGSTLALSGENDRRHHG